MERLAELAADEPFEERMTEDPLTVPDGIDQQRKAQFDKELAIVIHDLET